MTKVLKSLVEIGNQSFDFVHEISVSKSKDNLTNAGYIKLPKNLIFKDKDTIIANVIGGDNPVFGRGDKVSISVGYDDDVNLIFKGFVSNITPSFPINFDIEDSMFDLKNRRVDPLNLTNTTLENLLKKIIPNLKFSAVDINLGNFRIESPVSVAEVLDYIRKKYGLYSYYLNDDILYVGLAFPTPPNIINPHVFKFGTPDANIIDDSNLVYVKKDQVRLRITATSLYPDNTRAEIVVGDQDGEQRSLYKYNIPEKDLEVFAKNELDKLKYEGFRGGFETFLVPRVEVGDAIQIFNSNYPEKDGVYLVKSVDTTFGFQGGRQYIELETRLS